MDNSSSYKCEISGKSGDIKNMIPLHLLNDKVLDRVRQRGFSFNENGFLHAETVNSLMETEETIASDHLSADELERTYQKSLTFGERVADNIADFGGSWTFILTFLAFIAVWIGINVVEIFRMRFDDYPFILLNLILSCVAAIQAPIIMMSQNRQESKDRLRAQNDYQVNLKAEREIRELGLKIEELIALQKNHIR